MGQITVEKNVDGIEGLCVVTLKKHGDSRGYFMETYNAKEMKEAGLEYIFVQDNQSLSSKGVLRGLHFQIEHPQSKLVRVIHGKIFDVVVDLRKDSPSFGKWHGEILTEESGKQFCIPKGFAHGFLVLSDYAEISYKCDEFYDPEDEGGLAWNDPEIGIEWPELVGEYSGSASGEGYCLTDGTPLKLSERDRKLPGIREHKLKPKTCTY